MAKYVVTFQNGMADIICNSYEGARNLNIKGWQYIYCAPDKDKEWLEMETIPRNHEVWVNFFHMPQRAKMIGNEITFSDIPDTHYPLDLFEGWLPLDWFRYFEPDNEDMRYWQDRDAE